jgi:hypothetical protein
MGFKSIVKSVIPGGGYVDPGQKFLFGDKAGQAAETARLAEMFKQQNERARADLLGVLAERPEYKSVLGADFKTQRDYAFGDAIDPGFLLQRGRENQNLSDALQASTRAQGGQTANAYSQLAMNGGLSSGARERIAAGGVANGLLARQGLRSQNARNLTDLSIAEEGQRFQTRGGILQGQIQDATNANNYAQDNWKTRANTLAGLSQGEQQQTAALANRAQDKGACCFIFAEADALSPVVRRYRDEHMTELNRRGYYKLAEVLVPYMRHSRLVKNAVKLAMITPLTSYGEWHYSRRGFGFIFKPIKNFWMRAFDFLGGEHKFIRDNGEIV